jgi:hypothetical protein
MNITQRVCGSGHGRCSVSVIIWLSSAAQAAIKGLVAREYPLIRRKVRLEIDMPVLRKKPNARWREGA